jgi:hypothetical protein
MLFVFLDESSSIQDRIEDRFACEGGGGGGSGDSVSYTNLIPTYIPGFQDWTVEYLASAAALSMSNYTPYSGLTYAAQDANETDGIAALATRGRYGSTIELDGKALLRNLYDGLKIASNSKIGALYAAQIEALLQEFDEDVLPQIRANYVLAWGGSEHNVAEAKAAERMMAKINDIAKMYYDDYRHERSLQQQAMAHATPYGLQCIRDMDMLRQAGVYAREFVQKGYENDWEKWNDEMTFPIRNLDILGNAVRTILSTYRQTSTKYYRPSTIAQIAGVAIAGLSLYSMFSGTSMSPYTNAGVGKAGAEAGARAYSADNMGFDRSNPELIAGAGMPIKSGYGGF